jgi:AraC-like DNA-binding protein
MMKFVGSNSAQACSHQGCCLMNIATVPLPFAASLLAGIVAVRVMLVTRKLGWPNGLISLFFALLAVQAILTGFRFIYALKFVVLIQPVLAMLICPVAYLAFISLRGPGNEQLSKSNLWHLLPTAMMALIVWFNFSIPIPVDIIIWISFVVYSALLFREVREGPDTFERFGTDDTQALVTVRIATLCLLIAIMIFDVMIFLNFRYWDGSITQEIMILGSILLIAMSASMLIMPSDYPIPVVMKRLHHSVVANLAAATDEDLETFKRLEEIMNTKKSYQDPNINITRIARQLHIPARSVSNAVNRVRKQNFSLFVNRLRVFDACSLLENTDMPVTEIMFAAGFQTKSTFNREFLSITGHSPSNYRREKIS